MTPQSEEGDEMGHMKDLDRRIRQGGDDAIAAACELAAFPMERLRLLSQYGDCPDRDNAANGDNTLTTHAAPSEGREQIGCTLTDAEREAINMSRKILVSDPSMNPAQRAEWAITLSRLLDRTGFAQ